MLIALLWSSGLPMVLAVDEISGIGRSGMGFSVLIMCVSVMVVREVVDGDVFLVFSKCC